MKFWIGAILALIGIGCVVAAVVWQQTLCYQTFGAVFETVFIPHWSAWFYLGTIPLAIGSVMMNSD